MTKEMTVVVDKQREGAGLAVVTVVVVVYVPVVVAGSQQLEVVEGWRVLTVSGVSKMVVMVVVVVRVAVDVVLHVPLLPLHDGLRFVTHKKSRPKRCGLVRNWTTKN